MNNTLYTIGHSTHPIDTFVGLLQAHAIEAVADVRSAPYSRYNPQYNRENLKASLKLNDITYVYLGDELGARRTEIECYRDGKVDFALVRKLPLFLAGIERLIQGLKKMRVAVMCAEKEPLNCHRTLLISSHLDDHGIEIQHILADRSLLHHDEVKRIYEGANPSDDLFA